LTLSEGDAYTFEFTTLEYDRPEMVALYGGRIDVWFADFQVEDGLRIELFEDSIAESPVSSATFSGVSPPPNPPTPNPFFVTAPNGTWADLQGVVRFTMLTGSMTITQLGATVIRDEGGIVSQYYSTLPIPEPSVSAFVILGGCGLLFARLKRDKSQ